MKSTPKLPTRSHAQSKLNFEYRQLAQFFCQNLEQLQILKVLTETGLAHYGFVQNPDSQTKIPTAYARIAQLIADKSISPDPAHFPFMVEAMRQLYNDCSQTVCEQPLGLRQALKQKPDSFWVVDLDPSKEWRLRQTLPPTLLEIAGHAMRNTSRTRRTVEKLGLLLKIFVIGSWKLLTKMPYENSLSPKEVAKWHVAQRLIQGIQTTQRESIAQSEETTETPPTPKAKARTPRRTKSMLQKEVWESRNL